MRLQAFLQLENSAWTKFASVTHVLGSTKTYKLIHANMMFNFDRMTSVTLMNNTYDTPNSCTIWVSWKMKVWYGCQMSLNINITKKSIYCLAMCWIKDKHFTGKPRKFWAGDIVYSIPLNNGTKPRACRIVGQKKIWKQITKLIYN